MDTVARIWDRIQASLFPHLQRSLEEPLTDRQKQLAAVLEVVRIEEHVPPAWLQWMGRKRKDRRAIARAFVAKAVYNLTTTEWLVEMLKSHRNLLRLCGWEHPGQLPSLSTFSRAFAQFAAWGLGDEVHEALVRDYLGERLVGHICRDSTPIEAREKPVKKAAKAPMPRRGRGRPKKGEVVEKPPKRLARQFTQTAEEALAEIPTVCDIGAKRDSKGHLRYWIGYKLHIDVTDGGLPISAATTSASVHDSQLAIPLERRTAERITSLYSLMDAAYDSDWIRLVCRQLGHVPLIDPNPRNWGQPPLDPARAHRYRERGSVERAVGRLKEEFGGRHVRVRGHPKVHLHLMFGVLALFADQFLKWVT